MKKFYYTVSNTFVCHIVTVYSLYLTEEIYKAEGEKDYLWASISYVTPACDTAVESFVLWLLTSSTLTAHPYH